MRKERILFFQDRLFVFVLTLVLFLCCYPFYKGTVIERAYFPIFYIMIFIVIVLAALFVYYKYMYLPDWLRDVPGKLAEFEKRLAELEAEDDNAGLQLLHEDVYRLLSVKLVSYERLNEYKRMPLPEEIIKIIKFRDLIEQKHGRLISTRLSCLRKEIENRLLLACR